MRMMRSSGRPATFFQSSAAASSSWKTVTRSRSFGRAKSRVKQLPGVGDRPFLEVVAEREVAEHLEEGVVAGGVADVVEVVVLAAGAHAFLAGGGAHVVAVLEPGEDVLELHHAGVREHQRRVVARHQRRGRHDPVLGLGEVVEEGGADVVEARHGSGSALGAADDPRACRQSSCGVSVPVRDCPRPP